MADNASSESADETTKSPSKKPEQSDETNPISENGVEEEDVIQNHTEEEDKTQQIAANEDDATLKIKNEFSDVDLPTELTEEVTNAHSAESKFAVLKKLSEAVEISDRDLVDTVFNLVSCIFNQDMHDLQQLVEYLVDPKLNLC